MDQSRLALSAEPADTYVDGGPLVRGVIDELFPSSRRRRSPPPKASGLLAQRFRVDGLLAEGGMGSVHRGWHLSLNQPVAIKVLHEGYWNHPQAEALFLQEARIGAALRGSHVPRVLDYGRAERGGPFLVSELLEGEDLRVLLERAGTMPIDSALRLFRAICDALISVHAQGVVHRDVKPSNLFLATEPGLGRCLKLLDFGVALPPPGVGPHVDADVGVGSPLYMAPEQLEAPASVDLRADVWSLGVVLHEMLTGTTPFSAETSEAVCAAVLTQTPEPPSRFRDEVGSSLDQVVACCLRRAPGERFESVAALRLAVDRELARLDGLEDEPAPQARAVVAVPPAPDDSRRVPTALDVPSEPAQGEGVERVGPRDEPLESTPVPFRPRSRSWPVFWVSLLLALAIAAFLWNDPAARMKAIDLAAWVIVAVRNLL